MNSPKIHIGMHGWNSTRPGSSYSQETRLAVKQMRRISFRKPFSNPGNAVQMENPRQPLLCLQQFDAGQSISLGGWRAEKIGKLRRLNNLPRCGLIRNQKTESG